MRRQIFPFLLSVLFFAGGPLRLGGAADDWKAAKREFKAAQRMEDWHFRKDAYSDLAYFDTADAVAVILKAFAREQNPAVVLGGIETLAGYKSAGAADALAAALGKSKGARKLYVLMALERQPGTAGKDLLLGVLRGKDQMAAAQAALALGKKKVKQAIPDLLAMALSKTWQLRAAAARALGALDAKDAVGPLVKSLLMSRGSERRFIIDALTKLSGQAYGPDVSAWKKLAQGVDPAVIVAKPVKMPYAFGIPIYGRRVVFVQTSSQRNENPHRFGTGKRLEALCQVPGAYPIIPTRLVTVGLFIKAHLRRAVSDMPAGSYADLIIFNSTIHTLWPKLTALSGSTKNVAKDAIDAAIPTAGMNHYDALEAALDIAGSKDAAAWKKGPDEIVFTVCNTPNAGKIKEPDVLAAAISFKARLRMVPIHTIGVESHSYATLADIAKQTGGIYKNLYE